MRFPENHATIENELVKLNSQIRIMNNLLQDISKTLKELKDAYGGW